MKFLPNKKQWKFVKKMIQIKDYVMSLGLDVQQHHIESQDVSYNFNIFFLFIFIFIFLFFFLYFFFFNRIILINIIIYLKIFFVFFKSYFQAHINILKNKKKLINIVYDCIYI